LVQKPTSSAKTPKLSKLSQSDAKSSAAKWRRHMGQFGLCPSFNFWSYQGAMQKRWKRCPHPSATAPPKSEVAMIISLQMLQDGKSIATGALGIV
jgi:hypothetical protein